MIHRMSEQNIDMAQGLNGFAKQALESLKGLSPDEQSQYGAQALGKAIDFGDVRATELASKALQVMEKFPHFPRPRAAVVMRALETLSRGQA